MFINTLLLFHFCRNSQHPEKWGISFKNDFRKFECCKSCYLPIFSNLLKIRKTSLFVLTVTSVLGKCFLLVAYFLLTIVVIVLIKILEKHLRRSSVLENNFQKLFVSILITNSRTPFLKNSPTSCVWPL